MVTNTRVRTILRVVRSVSAAALPRASGLAAAVATLGLAGGIASALLGMWLATVKTVAAAPAASAAPTFNKDIAPTLYSHCATFHRPGEIAPFSLLTYDDASRRAK